MPVGVIYLLKEVDVADSQSKAGAGLFIFLDDLGQLSIAKMPVKEAGQGISNSSICRRESCMETTLLPITPNSSFLLVTDGLNTAFRFPPETSFKKL